MNRKKNQLLAGAILGIPLLATLGMMASIFNASPAHAAQTAVKGVSSPAAGIAFDKGNFDDPLEITNPYMPLEPETTFFYKGSSEGLLTRSEFVVTEEVKTILGVDTRVIRDTAWEAGQVVEIVMDD